MKIFRPVRTALAGAAFALAMLNSCAKSDFAAMDIADSEYSGKYNAMVTVKTSESGKSYMQLDSKTTLEPADWTNPYRSELRALVNYTELPGTSEEFSKLVRINLIEAIQTQDAALISGTSDNSKSWNDPVIVYTDWLTNCEDGYLTLHLAIQCEDSRIVHKFSLGVDPDSPRDVYLGHDKNGDKESEWKEFVVAFRLNDLVKVEGSGEKTVNVHFTSYDGGIILPIDVEPEN